MKKWSLIVASAFAVVAVFFFAASFQLRAMGANETVSSATIPRVLAAVLFIVNAIWVCLTLTKKDYTDEEKSFAIFPKSNWLVPVSMLAMVIYVALIDFVGFFVATGIFLLCLTMLYNPQKGWRPFLTKLIISVSLPIAIYLIFSVALRIYLPTGLLF